MVNCDSMFNLSSGVTCNWCIQLNALQSKALRKVVVGAAKGVHITMRAPARGIVMQLNELSVQRLMTAI